MGTSSIVLTLYAVVCIVEIVHFARIKTPKGTWALQTPAGFIWVLQLACIVFVKLHHDNVLRLFWLVPLSLLVYIVISRILYTLGFYRSGL
jgi:hypothetical protein